uniref:MARVEL domain-containing protein n=1 Tax=Panagrellus redivivus TaxID=6233 RepID=A0A7E4ZQM6_PANRE
MPDIKFNSDYLTTSRGVQKIVQIILGFVVCSVLCANWYGGSSCFGEGRLGFVSGLNFVVVIINIIVFILNLCNIRTHKFERFYSLIATVLFVVAAILLVWYLISTGIWNFWLIVTLIAVVVIFFTLLWDYRLLSDQQREHLPI